MSEGAAAFFCQGVRRVKNGRQILSNRKEEQDDRAKDVKRLHLSEKRSVTIGRNAWKSKVRPDGTDKNSEENMTLDEIRVQIDNVDQEIRELFIRRMHLSEQVAREKVRTEDTIYKPDREKAILENRSKGMEEDLKMEYRALLKRVMEVSRKYQYGLTLQLRDCFPFSFETEEYQPSNVGMIRDQLYLLTILHREGALSGRIRDVIRSGGKIHGARDYAELADLIKRGVLEEGVGVIEQIGKDVSRELNGLLLAKDFYINFCEVISDNGEKLKVVGFSKRLVVREHHNRLKIVFTVPNRSGALASILSMIADYGTDITQIHSVPFTKEGESGDWNYRFFLELSLNLLQPAAQALIYQLCEETEQMRLLGSYFCEGDFT